MTTRDLARLQREVDLAPDFSLWHRLPAKPPAFANYPASLNPRIPAVLAKLGVEQLYSHQAEAIAHVLAGRDTVVVTPTASGKTLCYNLPVLNSILQDPEARALYLFPTKALAQDLKVLEVAEEAPERGGVRAHGDIAVSFLATIFKKIKIDTHGNVGWGKIHIPQEDMHTTSYWLALGDETTTGLSRAATEAGLWGVAHLLSGVAPLFLICDPKDLQVVAEVRCPFTQAPTLFIYETRPGGIGFAKGLFDVHGDLLKAALELACDCECESGCPSCVGPSVEESSHMKVAAMTLLRRLVN